MTETTLLSAHPRYLISRIADAATVLNDIQDTTAGDSFSISTGYPEKYAIPFEKGGKPLNRSELNNVFNLLSQLHFYWQMGGVPVWDRRIASGEGSYSSIGGYPRNSRVYKMVDNTLEEFLSLIDNNTEEPSKTATNWKVVTMGGDAATKEYVDTAVSTLSGNAKSADLDLESQIESLSTGTMDAISTLSGNAQSADDALSGYIVELSGALSGASKGVKVLDVFSNKSSVIEILEETGHGTETFNEGDVLIVTGYDVLSGGQKSGTTKTSYVYGGEDWVACCGHSIDASKVFTSTSIDLAGEYTRIGNLTKSSTSTTVKDKFPKNTSIQQIITDLLDVSILPTSSSIPSNTIELRNGNSTATLAGEVEVGSKFTPWYKVSYTDGKFVCAGAYTNAGCPNNSRTVTDSEAHTLTNAEQSGTIYEEFTVGDGTNGGVSNYQVTASTNYGASTVVPKDNKGNEHPEVTIAAGTTVAKTSGTVTGIRYMFWGMNASDTEITADNASAIIRGLMSISGSTHYRKAPASGDADFALTTESSPLKASEVASAKRCIIAVPASSSKGPKLVKMPSSQMADITDDFKKVGQFSVEGANSYPGIKYNVWVYKPASLDSGETYAITIGTPKNP